MRKCILTNTLGVVGLLTVATVHAAAVGDIGAFYFSIAPGGCMTSYCAANNVIGLVDTAVFAIDKTSATDITNAVLALSGSGSLPIHTHLGPFQRADR